MNTNEIINLFKHTNLNEFECLTLFDAYKRIKENNNKRISIPINFKTCKKNLPTIIKQNLILPDHLKYCGMIVLSNSGIEFCKKYIS